MKYQTQNVFVMDLPVVQVCQGVHSSYVYGKFPKISNTLFLMCRFVRVFTLHMYTVNFLKFRTLYSILFWLKFCFLCSSFFKYLVEWQTV